MKVSCLKAIVKANRLHQFSNNSLNRNNLYNIAKSKSNQTHSFGSLLIALTFNLIFISHFSFASLKENFACCI